MKRQQVTNHQQVTNRQQVEKQFEQNKVVWQKSRWSLSALLMVMSLVSLSTGEALAFSRLFVPQNVAIATSDVIAVVHVLHAPEGVARVAPPVDVQVEVLRVLKGTWPGGTHVVRMSPVYLHVGELNRLKTGDTYIFFLKPLENVAASKTATAAPQRIAADTKPTVEAKTTAAETPVAETPAAPVTAPRAAAPQAAQPAYEVMIDGSQRYSEAAEAVITADIKLVPAWSEPQQGLATVLVADRFRVKAEDDINLWVGHKNVSGKDIVLKYRDWPLETHTHWKLQVAAPDNRVITPLPHPHLTRAEIVDYFSKHPHSFDYTLKPGQTFFFSLDRINSAKAGWGYKQRQDFKSYPMTQPGAYRISASGYYFYGNTVTQTKGLQVWVE